MSSLADMPEPGHVVMEHIPGVFTTIRATLLPGQSLTLPPIPGGTMTEAQGDKIIQMLAKLLERSEAGLTPITRETLRPTTEAAARSVRDALARSRATLSPTVPTPHGRPQTPGSEQSSEVRGQDRGSTQ